MTRWGTECFGCTGCSSINSFTEFNSGDASETRRLRDLSNEYKLESPLQQNNVVAS